ncbi:DUF998 domain-containing protein [Actinoplanes sp. RD1]|uniref:DUF998 domain-containing protein n=1 Tax=Actinoplanes sp. RD1 TaxID=3064538 RepID=UPI0027427E74|nr:DUF998 domain-containing protein [Actinoplanes sp. RD1]
MRPGRPTNHPRPRPSPALPLGALAAAQMIAVVTLDGATRPGYDPWRNWVSQLALGPQGWQGTLNMTLCSLWLTLYALALHHHSRQPTPTAATDRHSRTDAPDHHRRTDRASLADRRSPTDAADRHSRTTAGDDAVDPARPPRSRRTEPVSRRGAAHPRADAALAAKRLRRGARWVLACALSLALTAALPTDPGLGFPPGTPPATTLVGQLHQAAGILVYLTGLQATLHLGPRTYARIVAAVMTVAFAAATTLVLLDAYGVWPGTPSGLLERIALFTGLAWTGAAGLTSASPPPEHWPGPKSPPPPAHDPPQGGPPEPEPPAH